MTNDFFATLLIIIDAMAGTVNGFYNVMFTGLNLGAFGTYSLFSIFFSPATFMLFMTAVIVKKLV